MRALQAIFEHSTAVGQADKRMIDLEQGRLCDPELAIQSYWALFRDMIYAKIARLDAGQTSVAGPPDAHGNVVAQTTNPTHDVEHSIHFTKTKFFDQHASSYHSEMGKRFDDECREEFVNPLRSIVPNPSYIPTLIRWYAQDLLPSYDSFTDFAEHWLEFFTMYDEGVKNGLLLPGEYELGTMDDPQLLLAACGQIQMRLDDELSKKRKKTYN